jgi:succinate-semialdehyde dehydrogenase/glutarate-semialdehyde dehydrogenase
MLILEKLNVFKLIKIIKNKSMSIQTTNPATNKVLKSFDEMTDEQVEAAIEKSNTFSQTWKTSYDDRAKVLHKVAELMRQRKTNLS